MRSVMINIFTKAGSNWKYYLVSLIIVKIVQVVRFPFPLKVLGEAHP